MVRRPTTKQQKHKLNKSGSRLFRACFPNGTSLQRADPRRVFTHAYLVLFERPEGTDGYQRGFCQSWEEANSKVEAEKRWLSRHHHTFIEAFIVDVLQSWAVYHEGPRN